MFPGFPVRTRVPRTFLGCAGAAGATTEHGRPLHPVSPHPKPRRLRSGRRALLRPHPPAAGASRAEVAPSHVGSSTVSLSVSAAPGVGTHEISGFTKPHVGFSSGVRIRTHRDARGLRPTWDFAVRSSGARAPHSDPASRGGMRARILRDATVSPAIPSGSASLPSCQAAHVRRVGRAPRGGRIGLALTRSLGFKKPHVGFSSGVRIRTHRNARGLRPTWDVAARSSGARAPRSDPAPRGHESSSFGMHR